MKHFWRCEFRTHRNLRRSKFIIIIINFESLDSISEHGTVLYKYSTVLKSLDLDIVAWFHLSGPNNGNRQGKEMMMLAELELHDLLPPC